MEKYMKKILFIVLIALTVASCTNGVNYRVKIDRGDIRKTYTEDYILTERCTGCNGFGMPQWEDVSIENRSKETANEDISEQRESADKDNSNI